MRPIYFGFWFFFGADCGVRAQNRVCAFEMMMIREGRPILSVPGVPLTAEDCTVLIGQLLT